MRARIVRPTHGRLQIHGLRAPRPHEEANRAMLKTATGASIRPEWVTAPPGQPPWKGYWTIARSHLTAVAEAIAIRDGVVDIEMHYNTSEKCDRRCQNARGNDCTCSCEGTRHGRAEHAGWREVGDTTLVRSAGIKVVWRTLSRSEAQRARRRR